MSERVERERKWGKEVRNWGVSERGKRVGWEKVGCESWVREM